ncbi:MAG TPA: hypothetical protein VGR35_08535 [Tepidisphaeraceae bacterium]|nr:hypothetical protein [Tepidisphaeraceae bacterium]
MKRLFRGLALGALLVAPPATFAQDAEAEVVVEEPAVNSGNISLTGGVDFATHYFFRGYLQEDQDLIAQPYLNVYFNLMEEGDTTLTAYIGTWNSFHGEKTGADEGSFGAWYEADFVGGVDLGLGGGFTLGAIYTVYAYPNGAFDTIEEVGLKLSYDDTDKWGLPFALNPFLGVYFETDDQNGSEDTYLEFGIAPTVYTFDENSNQPIAVAVPITIGTSIDDYYFDDEGDEEFLGYGSIGLAASMPLGSGNYGDWTLNASVTWLQLFAEGLESANNDDDNEIIGKIGVSFSY